MPQLVALSMKLGVLNTPDNRGRVMVSGLVPVIPHL
jgi:hypothetical protein